MGEVHLCRDRQIGRDVAVKILKEPTARGSASRLRFLREGCLQAQLEPPSIVPVYDITRDENGNDLLVMRRIAGRTLASVVSTLRAGEPLRLYTRRRLLEVFLSVCRAIDYAHRRGVVHRDLK